MRELELRAGDMETWPCERAVFKSQVRCYGSTPRQSETKRESAREGIKRSEKWLWKQLWPNRQCLWLFAVAEILCRLTLERMMSPNHNKDDGTQEDITVHRPSCSYWIKLTKPFFGNTSHRLFIQVLLFTHKFSKILSFWWLQVSFVFVLTWRLNGRVYWFINSSVLIPNDSSLVFCKKIFWRMWPYNRSEWMQVLFGYQHSSK